MDALRDAVENAPPARAADVRDVNARVVAESDDAMPTAWSG